MEQPGIDERPFTQTSRNAGKMDTLLHDKRDLWIQDSQWFLLPGFRSDPDNNDDHQTHQEKCPPHSGFKNGFDSSTSTQYKQRKEKNKEKGGYFHKLLLR